MIERICHSLNSINLKTSFIINQQKSKANAENFSFTTTGSKMKISIAMRVIKTKKAMKTYLMK